MFHQLLSFCLFLGVAECAGRCRKVDLPREVWKNEGVAVIYVMKNTLQNWQTHVTALTQLMKNLKNIDVNVNMVIATDTDCVAFKNIREFQIDSGNIWKKLEHNDNYPEAYVIDRCGKLTYHIISPWSLVKSFSFVKGAILSTFFDKPCGPCDVIHSYQIYDPAHKAKEEAIKMYPKMSTKYGKESKGHVPIEIIVKDQHKHDGNNEVFEYSEMQVGNNQYHGHYKNINDIKVFPDNKYKEIPKYDNLLVLDNEDDQLIKIAEETKRDHFKQTTYKKNKKRIATRSEEQSTMSSSAPTVSDLSKKINEIIMMCTDLNDQEQSAAKYLDKLERTIYKALYSSEEKLSSDEQEERDSMFQHYQKLKNWLYYII